MSDDAARRSGPDRRAGRRVGIVVDRQRHRRGHELRGSRSPGRVDRGDTRQWRAAWTGWWLAVAVGSAIGTFGDFTNVGHGVALILGMAVGTRFGHPAHWTTARYALLAVAAAFGYLIMANTGLSILTTSTLGVLGALTATQVARRRAVRRALTVAPSPQPAVS